jgi:hypothetical protein
MKHSFIQLNGDDKKTQNNTIFAGININGQLEIAIKNEGLTFTVCLKEESLQLFFAYINSNLKPPF